MVRGWLSLLRRGTCTQKGKWCRVLGESSSDRGPVIGLRREPDRTNTDDDNDTSNMAADAIIISQCAKDKEARMTIEQGLVKRTRS